ncbi:growth hormone releasing hormone receptor a [Scyliorhinus canicula]|uniref:growth hormone releasing hormone receptor a n=1 Tax=Scyliorhinus canicula TaxID=7830 RepID=UPI0018F7BA0B|nr:growth hormone releasing hormone receptor a [Scyliorhinus canicula]
MANGTLIRYHLNTGARANLITLSVLKQVKIKPKMIRRTMWLKDYKLKENAKPAVHTPRRVPASLKEKLKAALHQMNSIHPECIIWELIHEGETSCARTNANQSAELNGIMAGSPGCLWEWNTLICWPSVTVGEIVNRTCPSFLDPLLAKKGVIYRNCTEQGWSKMMPDFKVACEFLTLPSNESDMKSYYLTFKQVYTAGYATSVVALVTAIIILTAIRKFHCTRNYIHLNLFGSFVLRAAAVFTKDAILFSNGGINHCSISTVTCKAAITFFQYCILANFSWLLVEGLYLQTLLSLTFVSNKKYFWWYCLIGWGAPSVVLAIWIILNLYIDNKGCWDANENEYIWWIIRGAILLTVLVNFLIFLNIIRILMQKLRSPDFGGNPSNQFSRLTKSTLLLIPLFGVHYIMCVFLPDHIAEDLRLHIELGIGSFQGFAVALLYCFLNGEVLAELGRYLRWWRSKRDLRLSRRRKRNCSTESSGTAYFTQISLFEKLSPKRKSLDQ